MLDQTDAGADQANFLIGASFAITAVSSVVKLDAKNQARGTFTVSNRTGQSIKGRAQVVPDEPQVAPWLAIEGAGERDFTPTTVQQFSIKIQAPPGTPTGEHRFRLDMTAIAPPLGVTEGPRVAFQVTTVVPIPKPTKSGYLATLVGAAGGAVVAAIIGAVPAALLALLQTSSVSTETVMAVLGVGALIAGVPAVGGGAWVNLRAQAYEGAMQTGLILAGIYVVWALLLGIGYAVTVQLTSGHINGGVTFLFALAIALVPPIPARALYLALKKAGRIR
jgi:hypothetical protein